MSKWLQDERVKTARNALILSLELAEKSLDSFPVYGPKAALSALLKVIEVAKVGDLSYLSVRRL
jgi:hypothetical protein